MGGGSRASGRKTLWGGLLLFLGLLSACTATREEEAVKRSVVLYNRGLIEAYRSQSFDLLKEVAVEREVEKVGAVVGAYLEGGEVMESRIISLRFDGVEVRDGRATVRTSEEWSYRWLDYRTGREVEPLKRIYYRMRYDLVKRDGRWLVEKVKVVSEEFPGSGGAIDGSKEG